MALPSIVNYGIVDNPLVFSVYGESDGSGGFTPMDAFLLLNGNNFALLNGEFFLLLA